jgi:hypothetical protein
MAQQAAPVDRRFTTDLNIGSFALTDDERNNVNDGFDLFLQNDDNPRRFLHYGDYRGLGKTFNEAWGNLNTSPCASWKYMETTIGNQGGIAWSKDKFGFDKWEDYLPIFNVNNHGEVVPRNSLGIYAAGMNMALRVEAPLCLSTTKVVIQGEVSF